ncbi:MAG: aldo/keto reductase, partial [Syntrophorhabdaceae bacterium]|nr:aldo/keto reductase [Syntrophorhabdaceae bacterium]
MGIKNGDLNRRHFLKIGFAGAALASTGLNAVGKLFAQTNPTPVYRTLGRTGLKITVVSFGAMLTPDPDVLRQAFDMGINYVDTARRYMGGRNEDIVGRAIKGYRDKVYIATKVLASSTTKKEVIQDVEKSLSVLREDYIDVIQLHNLTDSDRMFIPEVREALVTLRKQGKVRFFGVTT